jgi:hypothetical protein
MRIVLVSKYFPPSYGAHAVQIRKVCDVLTDLGWDITVIAGLLYTEIAPLNKYNNHGFTIEYFPYTNYSYVGLNNASFINKNRIRYLSYKSRFNWIKNVYNYIHTFFRHNHPFVLFTTSSPIDSHYIGLLVKRNSLNRWIASFSDPWPTKICPYPYNLTANPIKSGVEVFMMRKILQKSDALHFNNEATVALIEKHLNTTIRNKSFIIPHIASKLSVTKKVDLRGWLLHLGDITTHRVSIQLLYALKKVHDVLPDKFRGLLCVGEICSEFTNMAHDLSVDHLIKVIKRISYEETKDYLVNATALLIIEANMEASPFLPSKFADYVCSQKEIIVITPQKSVIRNLVKKYGGATLVLHDVDEISNAVINIFSAAVTKNSVSNKLCELFQPSIIGAQYNNLLNSLSTHK